LPEGCDAINRGGCKVENLSANTGGIKHRSKFTAAAEELSLRSMGARRVLRETGAGLGVHRELPSSCSSASCSDPIFSRRLPNIDDRVVDETVVAAWPPACMFGARGGVLRLREGTRVQGSQRPKLASNKNHKDPRQQAENNAPCR
jgi:hypothetical protein